MCQPNSDHGKEAMLASYSLFRGFLNAMDAEDPSCSRLFMCEASQEASRIGVIGKTLAKVGR